MVFESIVAGLLNRFLGDYVDNLDAKQLNLGIFGGDVVLNNLQVKQSALDDLDLPVRLKSGHLEKLSLKIPWKNLYSEPVIANIEGLYVLVVPNQGIKYNVDKENKAIFDAKQKELQKIEDARKAKKEKAEKKEPENDSFIEKVTTSVIKNLQITVENIHIRFEDEFTNRKRPFAAGVTLHSLKFQTTDENWNPRIFKSDEIVNLFHKLVDLDSLSIYWNSKTEMISHLHDGEKIKAALKRDISRKQNVPQGYSFILRPICITAKAVMNPKPERDDTNWKTPKISATLNIEEINVNMGKYQYQDIMEFMEGMERMSLSSRYRKYRPDLKVYKGHAKEWWHFAQNAVLKEEVQRRRRNWDFNHMKKHRTLVRSYRDAWVVIQTNKKPPQETLDIVTTAEKELDVLNLNVARQEANFHIDRTGLKRVEEQGGWGSWVSGWFGGGAKEVKPQSAQDFAKQFEQAMTPEEKAKLYAAIDYSEEQSATGYPKEFVENKLLFNLNKFGIAVFDDLETGQKQQVLTLGWTGVFADVEQRPSDKGALKVHAKMQTLAVEGIPGAGAICPLIASMAPPMFVGTKYAVTPTLSGSPGGAGTAALVDLVFETNPLDRSCDQRVQLKTQPLNVVYHAPSINKAIEVFRPPESVQLKQLTAAAMAKYEKVKERSATGLEYALQHRSVMNLDIDVQPTLILVPTKGVFEKSSNVLLVDLGQLRLTTVGTGVKGEALTQAHTEAERRKELMEKAYDKFKVELSSLQILYSGPDNDWQAARKQMVTPLHLLKPTGFQIVLERCTIDDIQLSRMKVSGNLPNLNLSISDQRLLEVMSLALSIPPPPPAPEPATTITFEEPSVATRAKLKTIMEASEAELSISEPEEEEKKTETPTQVQVNMELLLVLDQISVDLHQVQEGKEVHQLTFMVQNMGASMIQTAVSMKVSAYLGNVEVRHGIYKDWITGKDLMIIQNPLSTDKSTRLIELEFISADKKGPYFATDFAMTESKLVVKINCLHLNLHQNALVHLQKLANELTVRLNSLKEASAPTPPGNNQLQVPGNTSRPRRTSSTLSLVRGLSRSNSQTKIRSPRKKAAEQMLEDNIINTKIDAKIDMIKITIGDEKSLISSFEVKGMEADLTMRPSQMLLISRLRYLSIVDPNLAVHKQILSVEPGKDVFYLEFLQHTRTEEERRNKMKPEDVDMSVKVRFSELRFIFLNMWLTNVLGWLGPFQAAAQDAAAQTGAALAEKGKEGMQALYQQATRMLLDVEIAAPLVIVPRCSKSIEVLLVDLGKLRVKNKMVPVKVPDSQLSAVIDEMVVELLEMEISRGSLEKGKVEEAPYCQILEPVTFSLSVARNMSFEWFKARPEMAISARLPELRASLTQEDYGVIMATLSENFGEGGPPLPPPPPVTTKKVGRSVSQFEGSDRIGDASEEPPAIEVKQVSVETHASADQKKPASQADGRTPRLTFSFRLDTITAALYMGSSNLTTPGLVQRSGDRALTRIQLQTIAVDGRMMVDGAMSANVLVVSLTMDDARTGHSGITRLMDKRKVMPGNASTSGTDNVLDVSYDQDSAQNQKAIVKMTPFSLCFAPEFLAALMAFATSTAPKETDECAVVEGPVSCALPAKTTVKTNVVDTSKPKPAAAATATAAPRTGSFTLSFEMNDPEILLIEDASQPENTKALILKFDTKLSVVMNAEADVIQGGITSLQIFSSYYQESRRKDYFVPVLKPVDITMNSVKPFGKGQTVDVRISPFIIKVSPSIIQLLSTVASNFSAQTAQTQQEMQEKRIVRRNVWQEKDVPACNFWFLKVAAAQEADESIGVTEATDEAIDNLRPPEEQMSFLLEAFVLTLETGIGSKTIPLIQLQSVFRADILNWSSGLTVSGTLATEMAYFNEILNTWEPVIEPVEQRGQFKQWEMFIGLRQRSEFDEIDEDSFFQPPQQEISIKSNDMLELTVTKTFLDVVTKLQDVFTSAAKKTLAVSAEEAIDGDFPYHILNESGLEFEVLSSGNLQPPSAAKVPLPHGAMIGLESRAKKLKTSGSQMISGGADSGAAEHEEDPARIMLDLRMPVFNTVREVNISRADKRIFRLPTQEMYPGEQWALVSEVKSEFGQKKIILRSNIQVVNHMKMPFDVFFLNDINLEHCGRVQPNDGVFNVPLFAVHSPSGELFFRPAGADYENRYETSSAGVSWRQFSGNQESSSVFFCNETSGNAVQNNALCLQTFAELERACFENTARKTINTDCYKIHIRPAAVIYNILPRPLTVQAPGHDEVSVAPGENTPLLTVCSLTARGQNTFTVKYVDFEGLSWTSKIVLDEKPETLTGRTFSATTTDGRKLTMDLAMHCNPIQGCLDLSLYVPFWMVNKTGLDLTYREHIFGGSSCRSASPCCGSNVEREDDEDITVQSANYKEPVLFTFKGKNLFAKKKAQLKAADSEWSDKFPLDIVGSSGRVTCKTKSGKSYDITVGVQLGYSALTKIITFSPFYLIDNRCRFPIDIREVVSAANGASDWLTVAPKEEVKSIEQFTDVATNRPGQCASFWPTQMGKQLLMLAKYNDVEGETAQFPYSDTYETLLKLDNERTGIYVSVNVSETSVIISFQDYIDGMAAALIINDTEWAIDYSQRDQPQKKQLSQGRCVIYSWDRIDAKRELVWNCGQKKNVIDPLIKDGVGEFDADENSKVYWVSFLDGRQRVLLFTHDLAITMEASQPYEVEQIDSQITASIQGIGVSLVNNLIKTEVAYVSIVSSGIVWETKKKSHWKPLSLAQCKDVETAYEAFVESKNDASKKRVMLDKLDVDFQEMHVYKPFDRQLRRSFQEGFWARYSTSPHNIQIHAKLNKLQIDNQLPACVFPVMFAPVPPPKSVAAEAIPKPFTELSYVMRKAEHSNVPQIKYFKVLVQEMSVQVDQGFINAIIALFAGDQPAKAYSTDLYDKDLLLTQITLADYALQTVSVGQKAYYDLVHFSPIKIHLSFSQGGSSGDPSKGSMPIQSEFINLFVKSVGVTLTEIQDVVFKLGYYEEKCAFMSRPQLQSAVISHYTKQAVKQFYVLVLGLDVIGNPFGLVRSLGEGVQDLFYEPIQGAVQGPQEFAEGLALGVKSLLGHAVGGAAGAIGRITGTLGKGLAALTMDEEFQRKRQQQLNRRPQNIGEGMAQNTKGLVMGFYDGVTGVVMKPIEGAKEEGAAGFFKGVGKGVVGLVARPTTGVVDFVSGTFETVRTVADTQENVVRVRPPRFFQTDGIVRPYSITEAEGNTLLQETEKGQFVPTDVFVAHCYITRDKKTCLLLTDKRAMAINRSKIFGQWDCDWELPWSDLAAAPALDAKNHLVFKTKETKKKVLGLFGKSDSKGKAVAFLDVQLAQHLASKSVEAYQKATT